MIAIRREDLDKRGEQRVALTPTQVAELQQHGHPIHVQPAVHPTTGDVKRAFPDLAYEEAGAQIQEDLSDAKLIFGLKEVKMDQLLPDKVYLFFSHTHKGQVKNRPALRAMAERGISLIDYELITHDSGQRVLTAFTYFAGYAGMVDSLWTLGQRLQRRGILHPVLEVPQSIQAESLDAVRSTLLHVGKQIREFGTPQELPPLITTFLGKGKTSSGAQDMYDLLPMHPITLGDLPEVYANGDRRYVYKLVLGVPEMFRLSATAPEEALSLSAKERYALYRQAPQYFESNLDKVFPYTTLMMNCIAWSPAYPRLLTRDQTADWYAQSQALEVIGDITCDPEGAIQFSAETWIDEPVFVYNPATQQSQLGMEGEGIAVMAVTNLPCEFSADASSRFASELAPLLPSLVNANFEADTPESAGLPAALTKATILWKGQLTPPFAYMKEYLQG